MMKYAFINSMIKSMIKRRKGIMFGFLRKESSAVAAPVSGRCIRLEEVADKVFSSKMMGDGFAVIPKDDTAVAPVDGEIVMASVFV